MSQLLLAPEGLFPIADTADGQSALQLPIAGTIQGEGLLAGTPSLFLRLAGCNMFCHWLDVSQQVVTCDTVHALDPAKGNYETSSRLVEKILAHCGKIRHLVITGGEPLLRCATRSALRIAALPQSLPYHHRKQWLAFCPRTIALCKSLELFAKTTCGIFANSTPYARRVYPASQCMVARSTATRKHPIEICCWYARRRAAPIRVLVAPTLARSRYGNANATRRNARGIGS